MTDPTAILPPGAEGCAGIPVDGPGALVGRVNVLCRGCLRFQGREQADRHMDPPQIARGDGTYYCAVRIGG